MLFALGMPMLNLETSIEAFNILFLFLYMVDQI